MKRLVAAIVFGSCAVFALAQAPFTIVRPLDGSKVREKVRIQVPKASIALNAEGRQTQYVGILLDGKFLEARVLDLNGKFFEYILDTKERRVADGSHKIEVVLYADTADRVRIMDRSSVEVIVANSTSIPVPDNGFKLRYKFVSGREYPYRIEQKVKVSTITEAQAKLGGRASTLNVEGETIRMLYAVDNVYGNGDGLMRMQALPEKGKDYAWLTVVGQEAANKYYTTQMHPVYMRLTNTGWENFGSVPIYIPIAGSGDQPPATDLFASFPLPTLPTKNVRPGSTWEGRFLYGILNLEKFIETKSVTRNSPARGELLGMEWEMGHPCAKIRYSIAAGSGVLPGTQKVRDGLGRDRVQLEQTFWFALDIGATIKIVDDFQIDTRMADSAPAGAGGAGGPAAAGGGGGTKPGAGGAGIGQIRPDNGPTNSLQGRRGPGGPGGGTGGAGGAGAPTGPGGAGGQGALAGAGGQTGGRTGAPAVGSIRYLRYRIQRIQTLE